MEGKRVSKATSSMQVATKRLNENSEVVPAAKRQALETSIGSPKSSSPIKMAALSRETSFKNLDKERVRPAQQASLGIPSANDVPETARSPVAGSRLQTSKGEEIAFAVYAYIFFNCCFSSFYCFLEG